MTLNWKGDRVKAKVRRAEIEAVDTTMTAAINHAKSNHEPVVSIKGKGRDKKIRVSRIDRRFQNLTSSLSRSIRITINARPEGSGVRGQWGSTDIVYARRIELGFQGKDSLGRVFDQPAFPFLRPAADAEYPKLSKRIKSALAIV